MSFSVNTNTGAQVALQYLNATQGQLDKTQGAINSGLKVASAKDDGAIYAIAQNQRGAVAGYASVINSINNGSSAIDVALSAGQSISDLLIQMKERGRRVPLLVSLRWVDEPDTTEVEIRHRTAPASRYSSAIRIATPLVTWSVMTDWAPAATSAAISTPSFIGPGCMTSASGLAVASRAEVSP